MRTFALLVFLCLPASAQIVDIKPMPIDEQLCAYDRLKLSDPECQKKIAAWNEEMKRYLKEHPPRSNTLQDRVEELEARVRELERRR